MSGTKEKLEVKEEKNGMHSFHFRIRHSDKCSKYECKSNLLTVHGIAEKEEKYYKVIAVCDMCGTYYAFVRINRRYVE